MDICMRIWSNSSADGGAIPLWVKTNYASLKPYITEFLTSSHPYRNGAMCPFMSKALTDDLVYFTYFDGSSISQAKQLIKKCIKFFKQNIEGKHGTIIIIFKEDFSVNTLLKVHIECKEMCIREFIMLGALFENSPAPSLHSDKYFPLRTPVPTLVMRDLTSSDLMFLEPDHYPSSTKVKFLSAFIKRFEGGKKSIFTQRQVQKAKSLKSKYSRKTKGQVLLVTFMVLVIILLLVQRWSVVFK